jgi:hypothetical protein
VIVGVWVIVAVGCPVIVGVRVSVSVGVSVLVGVRVLVGIGVGGVPTILMLLKMVRAFCERISNPGIPGSLTIGS